MKTIKIRSVAVEYPLNTTKVSLDIVEISGRITRTIDRLAIDIPGLFPHMTTELFNVVVEELRREGFDVFTTQTADQPATNYTDAPTPPDLEADNQPVG